MFIYLFIRNVVNVIRHTREAIYWKILIFYTFILKRACLKTSLKHVSNRRDEKYDR